MHILTFQDVFNKVLLCRASSHKSRVMGVDEKKVLLLGAGMVSGPFADFYSKQSKVSPFLFS